MFVGVVVPAKYTVSVPPDMGKPMAFENCTRGIVAMTPGICLLSEMKKAPAITRQGYDWAMEFTDYMLWKLAIMGVAAFIYGFISNKS